MFFLLCGVRHSSPACFLTWTCCKCWCRAAVSGLDHDRESPEAAWHHLTPQSLWLNCIRQKKKKKMHGSDVQEEASSSWDSIILGLFQYVWKCYQIEIDKMRLGSRRRAQAHNTSSLSIIHTLHLNRDVEQTWRELTLQRYALFALVIISSYVNLPHIPLWWGVSSNCQSTDIQK